MDIQCSMISFYTTHTLKSPMTFLTISKVITLSHTSSTISLIPWKVVSMHNHIIIHLIPLESITRIHSISVPLTSTIKRCSIRSLINGNPISWNLIIKSLIIESLIS